MNLLCEAIILTAGDPTGVQSVELVRPEPWRGVPGPWIRKVLIIWELFYCFNFHRVSKKFLKSLDSWIKLEMWDNVFGTPFKFYKINWELSALLPVSLAFWDVSSVGTKESMVRFEAFAGSCVRIGAGIFLRAMSVKLRSLRLSSLLGSTAS